MDCPDKDFIDFIDVSLIFLFNFFQKCIEWKIDARMTPDQAFSHPFIVKAVNELKGLRNSQNEKKQQSNKSITQESILPNIKNK